ncbi:hypothetical protein ACVBIL_05780 [Shewanella sp. 125m-7]
MKTTLALTLILSLFTASTVQAATALPHEVQIKKHPEALEIVEAREMKFLIDPAKAGLTPQEGLQTIWNKVKAFAKKENIQLEEKTFDADGLTFSTKVYYDTPKGDLTKLGYVVRITTKYLEGKPSSSALTVKFIDREKPELVFTAMEDEEDASVEENVGPAANHLLDTYLEKSVKVEVELTNLPKTLADFAQYVPQLETLGLDPSIPLEGVGAYSVRMKPGFMILPGLPFPAGISMEAWLPIEGGEHAFVYDFSFGYPTGDYYDMAETHITAEKFMQKMYAQMDSEIGLPKNSVWRGSKTTYLRKGGLKLEKFTQLKDVDLRSYKEPAKNPDGTVAFNDDPS